MKYLMKYLMKRMVPSAIGALWLVALLLFGSGATLGAANSLVFPTSDFLEDVKKKGSSTSLEASGSSKSPAPLNSLEQQEILLPLLAHQPLSAAHTTYVDSLVQQARSLPTFGERVACLLADYRNPQPYTRALLDTLLVWTVNERPPQEWAKWCFYLAEYYRATSNRAGLQQLLTTLKVLLKRYPSEANKRHYFETLTVRIQMHIIEGDTEYARYAIRDMLQEAEAMNHNGGRFASYYLQVLLLSTDKSEEVNAEILRYLKLAEGVPDKTELDESWLLSRYYLYYVRIGDKEQALQTLERESELLLKRAAGYQAQGKPVSGSIYAVLLRNQLRMADLVPKEDTARRLLLLQQGLAYYPHSTFEGYKVRYLQEWAKYYRDMEEWEQCLNYCNQILGQERERRWQYLATAASLKAGVLEKLDRLPEAVEVYEMIVHHKDSLNELLHANHQTAIALNFQIKELLSAKLTNENWNYGLLLLGLLGLGGILCFVAVKLVSSEKLIRTKRRKIKGLYLEMGRQNEEKGIFIKRIVQQIDPQLKAMVHYAQLLGSGALEEEPSKGSIGCSNGSNGASEVSLEENESLEANTSKGSNGASKGSVGSSEEESSKGSNGCSEGNGCSSEVLSASEQQFYATQIREQAKAILNLVTGVLELSRLEVKRVTYNFEPCCLVTNLQRLVEEINGEALPNYHLELTVQSEPLGEVSSGSEQEQSEASKAVSSDSEQEPSGERENAFGKSGSGNEPSEATEEVSSGLGNEPTEAALELLLDWSCVKKVLHSLLRPRYALPKPVTTQVSVTKGAAWVTVTVSDTPLHCFTAGEECGIVHRINHLMMVQMGGSYVGSTGSDSIQLQFPLPTTNEITSETTNPTNQQETTKP